MSRENSLVTAQWVEDNLDTDGIVLVEVDEDTTAYDKGHIRGAIKLDWTTDLQDQARRDVVNKGQFEALLAALGGRPDYVGVWITRPNADPGHEAFTARLDAWAAGRSNVRVRTSLGPAYLSLLARVNAVVGNSSSGLAEAPSLGVATVDIGDRQAGRLAGDTVIHCEPETAAITAAIDRAMAADMSGATNPYGDGHSAARIVAVLRGLPSRETLLRKRFADV